MAKFVQPIMESLIGAYFNGKKTKKKDLLPSLPSLQFYSYVT